MAKGEHREPSFAGLPLTSAMYLVCAVHLLLCVTDMATLVVGTPLNLEGVIVSPLVQWIYGAFTLVSIVVIICAAVGTLYHLESHIDAYSQLLACSLAIDAVFFVVFAIYGRSCQTKHDKTHLANTLNCGLRDVVTLVCLALLVLAKLFGIYVVNKAKAYVRSAYHQNLLPFMQEHMEVAEAAKEPITSRDFFQAVPQSVANLWPSMRSAGTPFEQQPLPTASTLMPSMGPTVGYGSGGASEYLGSVG